MGLVEESADPEKLGRLKVRVPTVFGASGQIGVDELPWAIPFGMPAGGSDLSGGFSWLPAVGDQVMVMFLDGEPEKPVWTWGMQTRKHAAEVKLHKYTEKPDGIGNPERGIISRYGHSLEMTENTVILTTSQGYQLKIENSKGETGGSISIQTPAGQRVALNDTGKSVVIQGLDAAVMSAGNVILNAASNAMIRAGGNFSIMAGQTMINVKEKTVVLTTGSGATIAIDPEGNIGLMTPGGANIMVENDTVQAVTKDGSGIVIENGKISINGKQTVLNAEAFAIGTDAKWPAVMMHPALEIWMKTHTHSNGNNGSPTGPTIMPAPTQEASSTRTKMT